MVWAGLADWPNSGCPTVVNQLILFTRYPQPGMAKTRLIPVLGEAGAATLSQQMTEHTLAQVQALQRLEPIEVEIRFAGGTVELMRRWLGESWHYVPQGEGDLGDRLLRSLQSAVARGASHTVIIGTDCPELTAALLQQAFTALTQVDLVLGPAVDGGYYLIGLRQPMPALFQTICWSTDVVLQQTLAIAQQLQLTVSLLPPLSDVDRPEDLACWQRVSTAAPLT